MVRDYKKKSNTLSWTEGQLQLALQTVSQGKSINFAAKENGIPRSTLQSLVKRCDSNHKLDEVKKPNHIGGFTPVFSVEQEMALCKYILDLETALLGLTSIDLRKLAYDYAVKLNVKHNFNIQKGLAGKDWVTSFIKRHNLSFRKAENTSAARAHGFNRTATQEFFNLLDKIYKKYNLKPENIYNVDETGVSIVPKSAIKVIAKKGRRQVGGLIAAERGETVTATICMSAAGYYMPPMLIIPRVKFNEEFLQGKMPGSWAEFHKSGWMQIDIFTRWVIKFIEFSRASIKNPVLLILDGHSSHVKNLEVIELAQKNGLIIVCFPPHTTHKMQPLDVSFMKPLSNCYTEEVLKEQRQGVKVTLKMVFSLFSKAFTKAAKMDTAINAFKKCGIYPFNPNIFSDQDFAMSEVNNDSTSSTDSSISNCSSSENQNVTNFTNILHEISNPKASEVRLLPDQNDCLATKVLESNGYVSIMNIPKSYIEQAKPLLQILGSACNGTPILQNSTSVSVSHSTDFQLKASLTSQKEGSGQPPMASNSKSDIPVKKSNRKGKAEIITDESYYKNLLEQKSKNIKKEPGVKENKKSKNIKKEPGVRENKKSKNIKKEPNVKENKVSIISEETLKRKINIKYKGTKKMKLD